jgi:hypothetical protein
VKHVLHNNKKRRCHRKKYYMILFELLGRANVINGVWYAGSYKALNSLTKTLIIAIPATICQ